jgi:hypothetical protein
MRAPPANAPEAFAEYAADRFWVVSHLGQLLGVVSITVGLVALSWRLRVGRAGTWALLGAASAIATLALSGALQAVDGVALKIAVDRWSQSAPEARALAFEGAVAVRQIEVGFAAIVTLFAGLTAMAYAAPLRCSVDAPDWLGWLGFAAGAVMIASGVILAHAGFSDFAMTVTMPSSLLFLSWTALSGMFQLRWIGASDRRSDVG